MPREKQHTAAFHYCPIQSLHYNSGKLKCCAISVAEML